MKPIRILALLVAGCSSQPAGPNPPEVWIGENGGETMIRLVPVEPNPF